MVGEAVLLIIIIIITTVVLIKRGIQVFLRAEQLDVSELKIEN